LASAAGAAAAIENKNYQLTLLMKII